MNIIETKKGRFAAVLSAYFLLAIFLLSFVLKGDTFGLIYDWNTPLLNFEKVKDNLFSVWSSENNGMVLAFKTFFFSELIFVGLSKLGLSALLIMKTALIVLFTLMGTGVYLLLRAWKFSGKIAFLGGLFYLSSTFIFIRLSSGYFGYIISAAIFPLLLYTYYRSIEDGKLFNKHLIASLLLSLFVFAQIHFFAYLFFFFLVDVVVAFILKAGQVRRRCLNIFLILLFYFLTNIFWILPVLTATTQAEDGLRTMVFGSRIDSLPHSFWNTLLLSDHANTNELLIPVNALWWRLSPLFFMIFIGFFLAHKNKKRRPLFIFSLVLCIFMLVLSVGASAPFTKIYPLIFNSIPTVSLFRETYHLQFLLLISYIIVLAIALEFLFNYLRNRRAIFSALTFTFALFSIIFFNLPSFSLNLYGYLGSVDLSSDLNKLNDTISSLSKNRIFFPPSLNFWKAEADRRIGVNYPDQIALSLKNSFVNQASSDLDGKDLSWKIRNATVNAFITQNPAFPSLLKFLGSDLIVDRKYLSSYYPISVEINKKRFELRHLWLAEKNEEKLKSWPELKKTSVDEKTDVYKLSGKKDLVYLSVAPARICNFGEITDQIDSFVLKDGVILDQYLLQKCGNLVEKALIDSDNKLDFGKLTLKHSADLGWSPGYLSFYENDAFSNTSEDFIFTRIPDQFTFQLESDFSKKLYLKYYNGVRAGRISVNDRTIETKSNKDSWSYLEIVPSSSKEYTIKSLDGENAIGGFGFLTQGESIDQAKILGNGSLEWTKIEPSIYRINISNQTNNPKLVVLQENYDTNWQLEMAGQNIMPIMINSYANAFLIPGDLVGEGRIVYSKQPLYLRLIWFSLSLIVVTILYLAYLSLKKRRGER